MSDPHDLEARLRLVRRPRIDLAMRPRVLAAAARPGPPGSVAHGLAVRTRPWRFIPVAGALALAVAAGIWCTWSVPDVHPPDAPGPRESQVLQPPGDDVVVFWVDDDTPVFVDLSESP